MPEADFTIAIDSFARLSRADQSAIARRLSVVERQRLRALITTRERAAQAEANQRTAARKVNLAPYSAWLSRRISRIVDGKTLPEGVTPATRAALRRLLSEDAS